MDRKQEIRFPAAMIGSSFGLALLLAGCDGTPIGAKGVPTKATTPATRATVAFHPGDSIAVGCDAARSTSPTAPEPDPAQDLIIGPLVYPGLGDGYNRGSKPYVDADGIAFFKEGTELPPDTTVTVSIADPARTWAGILIESGIAAGYSSVTCQGCSSESHPGRVFWVGGFTLGGKTSACVPLEVLVAGEGQPHHVTLSLEAGKCG